MPTNDLDHHSVKLEEAFFATEHAGLLDQLRRKTPDEQRRDLLRQVVRIDDEAFLDRLVALQMRPETALAIRRIPLLCVAWAEGSVGEPERKAMLDAARDVDVAAQSTARKLLESGLERKPDPRLLAAWKAYVSRLWGYFTADEQLQMRHNLLETAREVAEAAGGFLGLTSKISPAERAVLEELERTVP